MLLLTPTGEWLGAAAVVVLLLMAVGFGLWQSHRRVVSLQERLDSLETAVATLQPAPEKTPPAPPVIEAPSLPSDTNPIEHSWKTRIDDIIRENISNPEFGIDYIVSAMHTSRSVFYTHFKEVTGQSIGNYINNFRTEQAKTLLANPDLSINEIADSLGFSSQRYFSSFFKEKTGMTPSAFRQRQLGRVII